MIRSFVLIAAALLSPCFVFAGEIVPLVMRSVEVGEALEHLDSSELIERQAAVDLLVDVGRSAPRACATHLLGLAYQTENPERIFRLVAAIDRLCREDLYRSGDGALGVRLERISVGQTIAFRVLELAPEEMWRGRSRFSGDGEPEARASARLQVGDVIVQVDGEGFTELSSARELEGRIARHQAGSRIEVGIQRGGAALVLKVVLISHALLNPATMPSAVPRGEYLPIDEFVAEQVTQMRAQVRQLLEMEPDENLTEVEDVAEAENEAEVKGLADEVEPTEPAVEAIDQ